MPIFQGDVIMVYQVFLDPWSEHKFENLYDALVFAYIQAKSGNIPSECGGIDVSRGEWFFACMACDKCSLSREPFSVDTGKSGKYSKREMEDLNKFFKTFDVSEWIN